MCFSLGYLAQILIWAVIFGAVIAVVRLLLPMALASLGAPGATLAAVINIVIWAVIIIFIIWICVDLVSCLGGLSFPRHG